MQADWYEELLFDVRSKLGGNYIFYSKTTEFKKKKQIFNINFDVVLVQNRVYDPPHFKTLITAKTGKSTGLTNN